jgi:hypothetical protein
MASPYRKGERFLLNPFFLGLQASLPNDGIGNGETSGRNLALFSCCFSFHFDCYFPFFFRFQQRLTFFSARLTSYWIIERASMCHAIRAANDDANRPNNIIQLHILLRDQKWKINMFRRSLELTIKSSCTVEMGCAQKHKQTAVTLTRDVCLII